MNKRILSFLIGVATMMCNGMSCGAQTQRESYVDIFSGVEFNYRNIYYNNKLYDLLINLTPGFKWHLKHQWMIAAEGYVPIYNDYGERYKRIRLNMAVVSKEAQWGKQFFKFSGGLFGRERYGIDVKWMYPMNHWLAVDAQIGYTGFCSMAVDWECSKMERVTGWIGARMYMNKLNTEFRLQGGRYIYEDYGVRGGMYATLQTLYCRGVCPIQRLGGRKFRFQDCYDDSTLQTENAKNKLSPGI